MAKEGASSLFFSHRRASSRDGGDETVATVGRTVERWAREGATGRKPYSEGLRRRVAAIELGNTVIQRASL